MATIDLARLRKQANRLADFFFIPDEFASQLDAMLDTYVDHTVRRRPAPAPGFRLLTYRTPPVVLRQIEQELSHLALAPENADSALDLADRLWDEGRLEDCLLAAFLLGSITPNEGRLFARLTAWIGQVNDPTVHAQFFNLGLRRMRREAPAMFLDLLGEWLRPARASLWRAGLQAAMSAVADADFRNLPPMLDVLRPVVEAAPSSLQLELEGLILALFAASDTETSYFVRQVLIESTNPMTAISFRRMSPSFPPALQEEIREFVRGKPFAAS
jgi:hypothetical protein